MSSQILSSQMNQRVPPSEQIVEAKQKDEFNLWEWTILAVQNGDLAMFKHLERNYNITNDDYNFYLRFISSRSYPMVHYLINKKGISFCVNQRALDDQYGRRGCQLAQCGSDHPG